MKIIVVADGNPLSHKTWSGTSYQICKSLQDKNLLGETINFKLKPFLRKLLTIISIIHYRQQKELNRGRFLKYARSGFLNRILRKYPVGPVLHMSNMAFPFRAPDPDRNHYLLIDSSWNQWRMSSQNRSFYKNRFIKDAEKLEEIALKQSKHIFTLSESTRNNLVENYNINQEKITVVGTGRGIIQPYYGDKDYGNKEILFVAKSRFVDKGGDLLIESFMKASLQDPDIRLNIVGRPDYLEKYRHINNLNVFGFIPEQELQQLFNDSALYVMPAINEPWGLVYLEALSCKTPIIGLNRNAFPEICQFGKYGFIIDKPDPDELAKVIVAVFKDPEKLAEMGVAGQEFVTSNFTWDRVINKIINAVSA